MTFLVAKADGKKELFKVSKLKQSLSRSGASPQEIGMIIPEVEKMLFDGITTQEIYRRAFEMLRASETVVAARYSLRRALFNLGPTGFPFEDFLAKLFEHEGYTTKTRLILKGKCAEHEIDVAAYKNDDCFIAEAKFHSHPGMKSDLQVALYSFARLHDLQNLKICNADICGIKKFMIVTNTKFTSAAEKYALCSGLELLSWEFPKGNNLHDRIERSGLYPVTVLQTLSPSQKRALIEKGIVVCTDLLKKPQMLDIVHITQNRKNAVLDEARKLSAELIQK
jgi:hypothetical protein